MHVGKLIKLKGEVCMCVHSRVQLFVTPWTVACRLLCPWNSPGKNTGVGCQNYVRDFSNHLSASDRTYRQKIENDIELNNTIKQ